MSTIQSKINRDAQTRIGLNMRRLRNEHGYSLEVLAEKTHLTVMTVHRLETAKSNTTSMTVVDSLADVYGMTQKQILDELLRDVEAPKTAGANAYCMDFDNIYPYNLVKDLVGSTHYMSVDLKAFADRFNGMCQREREILEYRYRDGQTLGEIALRYGVTKERIRQIEAVALRRLRHNANEYLLISREAYRDVCNDNKRLRESLNLANKTIEKMSRDGCAVPKINDLISLDEMNLSRRSRNCMARAGKWTVGEIAEMSAEEMLSVRSLGMKSMVEIYRKLKEYGYDPDWFEY